MLRRSLAVLFLTFAIATPSFAAEKAVFTEAQKDAINAQIKDFILANPQAMISSVEAYYNKQNQQKQAQEGPLKEFPAGLLDYPGTPTAGPKNAKVSVVEFFDYNCGFCKQVATDVERLIEEDKNVRVVFKDLPILSDTSEVAARYALAADKQGKYLPFHESLLTHQGPINEEFLIQTAKSVGLDTDKLKKDANTQEVRDMLNKNVELARILGVRGTPFFVIGKQKVPGAIGYSRMKELIAAEGGDVSSAKPTAAAKPTAVEEKAPEVKADTTSAVPAPVASDVKPIEGTPTQDEIDGTSDELKKARAEARAMVDEIKAEAEKMQKQASDQQAKAEADLKAAKELEANKKK